MASAEQKKSYAIVKQFKGLNTKANRTAIDKDEFNWIENAMPIGFGNIKITPTSSAVSNVGNVAVVFSNTVSYLTSANVTDDYIIASETNGQMEYFDLTTSTWECCSCRYVFIIWCQRSSVSKHKRIYR